MLSEGDLEVMERVVVAGLARAAAVLTLRVLGSETLPLVVSGGLNAFVGVVEAWRPDWASLVGDRRGARVGERTLEEMSACRGRVDVLGVAEGELCFPGAPLLELHGGLLDVLALLPAARGLISTGCAAVTGAAMWKSAVGGVALVHEPRGEQDEADLRLDAVAARIAGWTATTSEASAAAGGLPVIGGGRGGGGGRQVKSLEEARSLIARSNESSPGLLLAEPRGAMESAPALGAEISLLAGELGDELRPPGCGPGAGARHSYRLLDLDGQGVCDLVVARGQTAPEPARRLLERYADLGRACRPLPDPVRSAALHVRASAEVSGLAELFSGRRRYEVRTGPQG